MFFMAFSCFTDFHLKITKIILLYRDFIIVFIKQNIGQVKGYNFRVEPGVAKGCRDMLFGYICCLTISLYNFSIYHLLVGTV